MSAECHCLPSQPACQRIRRPARTHVDGSVQAARGRAQPQVRLAPRPPRVPQRIRHPSAVDGGRDVAEGCDVHREQAVVVPACGSSATSAVLKQGQVRLHEPGLAVRRSWHRWRFGFRVGAFSRVPVAVLREKVLDESRHGCVLELCAVDIHCGHVRLDVSLECSARGVDEGGQRREPETQVTFESTGPRPELALERLVQRTDETGSCQRRRLPSTCQSPGRKCPSRRTRGGWPQ